MSRSTAIEMWKSGRSPASSVVRGWSHSSRIASRPLTMADAGDRAATGRQHVLAVAGGVDEGVGQGLHRQRRDRFVDARRTREVGVLEAARAIADGSLGAQAVGARVGPDQLPVGHPELVVGFDRHLAVGGHDLGVARVADDGLHRRQLLAARGLRPFLDAQTEGREAQLGVAHEVEQLGDRRQAGIERRDLRESPSVRPGGQGGGTIPQTRLGHRADCSRRGWWRDASPDLGLDRLRHGRYISHHDIACRDRSAHDREGTQMPTTRRTVAIVAGPVLAVLVAASVIAGPPAPNHASATFVDATGAADRLGQAHGGSRGRRPRQRPRQGPVRRACTASTSTPSDPARRRSPPPAATTTRSATSTVSTTRTAPMPATCRT